MDLAVDAFAPLFGVSGAPAAPTSSAKSSGVGLVLEQNRLSDLCRIAEIQLFGRFV